MKESEKTSPGFRLDSEKACRMAEELERKTGAMRAAVGSMDLTVGKTKECWKGEAGDAHRACFLSLKTDAEMCLRNLARAVEDLGQMIGVYLEAEQVSREEAENLPGQVER